MVLTGCITACTVSGRAKQLSTFLIHWSSRPMFALWCLQTTVQDELAALEVDTEQPEPAQFALNFLWLNKNIAVAVDQLFDEVIAIFTAVCSSSRQRRVACAGCTACYAACYKAQVSLHGVVIPSASASSPLKRVLAFVGQEESCHRVLLLAPKRCMGGAQGCSGGPALDSRAVSKLLLHAQQLAHTALSGYLTCCLLFAFVW